MWRSNVRLLLAHNYSVGRREKKSACCQILFKFLVFSVTLRDMSPLLPRSSVLSPGPLIVRPPTFFTDNRTIKTLSLNNRFTGHWGLMTVGVEEQMNPSGAELLLGSLDTNHSPRFRETVVHNTRLTELRIVCMLFFVHILRQKGM